MRGAIFNMLASRSAIEGACVLDAFCGTGALGLEALSRGAETCEFMDKSRTSLALAHENAELLGVGSQVTYIAGDARKVLSARKRCESVHNTSETHDPNIKGATGNEHTYKNTNKAYSLIFLDPPYHKGLITEIVRILKDVEILSDDAWIVCEGEKEFSVGNIEGFRIDSKKEYGTATITLLQYEGTYGRDIKE